MNDTLEVASVLLEAGAEVSAQGPDGWTPLLIAASKSWSPEVVEVLIDAGADLSAQTSEGQTTFYLAGENLAIRESSRYCRLNEEGLDLR